VARAAGARLLRHDTNRGKGHALVTGFRRALEDGHQAVLTLDGDGQHSTDDVPRFLAYVGAADLVIGQRRLRPDPMPIASFIGNATSTFWVSLFTHRFIPDAQCGFRLYSARLLRQVPLTGGKFETETELLIRALRLGLRVQWVPIATIYQRGQHRTHFRNFSDSLRVIRTVVSSVRYPKNRARRPEGRAERPLGRPR